MYFPELNDEERKKLEILIYRTARLHENLGGYLQQWFEDTDLNHNGLLEKDEIEEAYKNENAGNCQSLAEEVTKQTGPLSKEFASHLLEVYQTSSDSLNDKVQELIKENGLTGKIEINLETLKNYYEKTYYKTLEGLGEREQLQKIITIFGKYLGMVMGTQPGQLKQEVEAKFGGAQTLESMLEKRKAGTNELAFVYFDIAYLYSFILNTKDEEYTFDEQMSYMLTTCDQVIPQLNYFKESIYDFLNQIIEGN